MPDRDDAAERRAALRLLETMLRNAATLDQGAKSASQQRLAAAMALNAFLDFMTAHALQAYQTPVSRLALALLDLDKGRVAPMLQTKPRGGRGGPTISLAESIHRAHAAYIADGLMKHAGMGLHDAAKWVAAKLAAAGHDVSFHTIIDWRKDARRPRKNGLTHESYCRLQKAGRAHWRDPMPYAETLILKIIGEKMQKGE